MIVYWLLILFGNYKNSNVELFDSLNSFLYYTYSKPLKPEFVLDNFNAKYEGRKLIGLTLANFKRGIQ